VGLELFRLHSTHLIASLRVDAPFYTIGETDDDYYYETMPEPLSNDDEYHVPVTLNVGVGF
jgi:hypothetical protein